VIIHSTVLSVVLPSSSEEHIVSIFAVEEQAKQEIRIRQKGEPESGGDMLLRNVVFSPNYTA
jgi:hypothetical protein